MWQGLFVSEITWLMFVCPNNLPFWQSCHRLFCKFVEIKIFGILKIYIRSFFAVFMSLWATTFLELWKRKQSMVVWEWDLHNVENDEEPRWKIRLLKPKDDSNIVIVNFFRPEFETSVKTFRINPVTREKEAFMPYWHRVFRLMATGSIVLFMVSGLAIYSQNAEYHC